MKKIGFLFGAGAEISYGFPDGGMFALDIFREDSKINKEEFISFKNNISLKSKYAFEWLPEDFINKKINVFGKSVIENIVKDTISHKKENILRKFSEFDLIAEKILSENIELNIKEILNQKSGDSLGNCYYNNVISYNKILNEGNDLFSSKYFSVLLEIYKLNLISEEYKQGLKKILISLLQLQISALGENLVKRLNENLFEKKEEEIDLFDEVEDLLLLNYKYSSGTGVNYLYENKCIEINEKNNDSIIVFFAHKILEKIFSSVLDYKSLIDANWHYLYYPKNEWTKFCKINIFLITVKNYILKYYERIDKNKQSYYDDVKKIIDKNIVSINGIATTNYNTLIKEKLKLDITYFNGSVNQWYDPYLNIIDTKEKFQENNEKHFIVPLLFTQSGTKPMTSIQKTLEYANLYKKWSENDILVTIGFGFNSDDEHIVGIIRNLLEFYNKKIIVIGKENSREDLARKIRTNKLDNIEIINVDNDRKTEEKKYWYENLLSL